MSRLRRAGEHGIELEFNSRSARSEFTPRLAVGVRPSQLGPMPCAPVFLLGPSGIGKFVNGVLRTGMLFRTYWSLRRCNWFQTVCGSIHLLFSFNAAAKENASTPIFFLRELCDRARPKASAPPQAKARRPSSFAPTPRPNFLRAWQRCADSAISR